MWYLFGQIWVWLLAAFILGWAANWFLCCRGNHDAQSIDASSTSTAAAAASTGAAAIATGSDVWKPQGFASAPASVDDLKRIKGIGAVIEKTLNELGVYQFEQIASWSADNVSWVENSLAFPGRIKREDWINQAITLKDGGTTDFAKRVDTGDVGYD